MCYNTQDDSKKLTYKIFYCTQRVRQGGTGQKSKSSSLQRAGVNDLRLTKALNEFLYADDLMLIATSLED